MGIFLDLYIVFISLLSLVMIVLSLRRHSADKINVRDYNPKTLVMIPCKGVDLTLEQNLRSLTSQNYRNYDIIAIVDNTDDKSLPLIKKLGIKFLLKSNKFEKGSGKVNAISTAIAKYKDYQVYVIADSDIYVKKNWLYELVRPLGERKYGLSTTFPQFRAMGGFWSQMKTVWGIVGMGLMESNVTRFGWGGSLAFRKELVSKKQFDYFSRSISDDIALTRICKRNGLKIFYSRAAEPVVNVDDGFVGFIEWANRQTAFSVHGDEKVFYFGIAYYFAQILLIVSAIWLSIIYTLIFLLFFLPIVVHMAKNYARITYRRPVMLLIELVMPFIFFYNLVVGKIMDSVTWRGKRYNLSKTFADAPRK